MSIIYVDQQATGGDGTSWQSAYQTLEAALDSAGEGDEIWIASGTYVPGSAPGDSFVIEQGVSIYGGFVGTEENRSDRDYVQNPTILSGDLGAAGKSYRVVTNQSSAQVRLDGVVIQDGDTTGSSITDDGGGIYNTSNSLLLLENVIVQNNVASDDGGGIRNDGELIIVNSTVANNQANGSDLTTGGGGLINTVGAQATIIGSTFSGNQSLRGGAIRNDDSLTLINTTLSGNAGGGLLNTTTNPLSEAAAASHATIVGSTITQNGGAGIDSFGSVTLANSIVAGNNGASDVAAYAFGSFESSGHNLIGDRGSVDSFTDSDFVGTAAQSLDPLLGDLQNNGGFTQTHQPTEGSLAIDGGSNALISQDTLDLDGDSDTTEAIPFDQRGSGFDRVSAATVDIGAVESEMSEPEVIEPEEPGVIEPEEPEQPEIIEPEEPEIVAPEITEPEIADPAVVEPEIVEPETSPPIEESAQYVKLSLRTATSEQTDSGIVLTVDEQRRLIEVDLNDFDLNEIELSGVELSGIDLGDVNFDDVDWSLLSADIDLFTDLFGEAQSTLAGLQLELFDGLTLSRTQRITDSIRSSLTSIFSEAIAQTTQSELYDIPLEDFLTDSAVDSLIEQVQARGDSISFQLRSSSDSFQDMLIFAELTQEGLPIGADLQELDKPELIELRNVSETLTATFEVYREAAFDNQVGFFEIEDITGQVLDADGNLLGVGDDGYVLAAMQRRIDLNLETQDGQMSTYTAEITGGKLLSSFIVSNGSIEELLDGDTGNDPAVFFSHAGANSDRTDHVKLLGDNIFGYEDQVGGGDRDFNDVIVKAVFA